MLGLGLVPTLLENLTGDANAQLYTCDVIFDYFPLFDETLRHIELCNSVLGHLLYSEIRGNFSKSAAGDQGDKETQRQFP